MHFIFLKTLPYELNAGDQETGGGQKDAKLGNVILGVI
jgi:hypothetical protein